MAGSLQGPAARCLLVAARCLLLQLEHQATLLLASMNLCLRNKEKRTLYSPFGTTGIQETHHSAFIQQLPGCQAVLSPPSCASKQLEGSTLQVLSAWLVTGPTSLGRVLACLAGARTLPPKAPHSSSEWPPGVSSPPVVPPEERPTYRPHRSRPRGCQKLQPFFLIPKLHLPTHPLPSSIKPFPRLVARGQPHFPQQPTRNRVPFPDLSSAAFRTSRSGRQDGARAHPRPP